MSVEEAAQVTFEAIMGYRFKLKKANHLEKAVFYTAKTAIKRERARAEAEAEKPESVREEWFILGHPGWPGGIDFRTREQAEEHYWATPKLDGTRDGIRLFHRTITRYREWVPVEQEGADDE